MKREELEGEIASRKVLSTVRNLALSLENAKPDGKRNHVREATRQYLNADAKYMNERGYTEITFGELRDTNLPLYHQVIEPIKMAVCDLNFSL